jgi:hypothetical protein
MLPEPQLSGDCPFKLNIQYTCAWRDVEKYVINVCGMVEWNAENRGM